MVCPGNREQNKVSDNADKALLATGASFREAEVYGLPKFCDLNFFYK